MKFRINDRVRIIGKSIGTSIENENIIWDIGDIAYVARFALIDGLHGVVLKRHRDSDPSGCAGVFAEKDLEKVFFKGDIVRVLNKTTGCPLEDTEIRKEVPQQVHTQDATAVYIKDDNALSLYTFEPDDLVLIREAGESAISKVSFPFQEAEEFKPPPITSTPTPPYSQANVKFISVPERRKFKFKKDFTINYFLSDCSRHRCNARNSEIISFIDRMGGIGCGDRDAPIRMTQKFYDYFTQHSCFVDYLLSNGYIEEVKAFKPFNINLHIKSEEEWERFVDIMGKSTDALVLPIYEQLDRYESKKPWPNPNEGEDKQ